MSVECRGGEGGNGRLLEEVSPTFTQRAGTGAHRLHPQSPPWFNQPPNQPAALRRPLNRPLFGPNNRPGQTIVV